MHGGLPPADVFPITSASFTFAPPGGRAAQGSAVNSSSSAANGAAGSAGAPGSHAAGSGGNSMVTSSRQQLSHADSGVSAVTAEMADSPMSAQGQAGAACVAAEVATSTIDDPALLATFQQYLLDFNGYAPLRTWLQVRYRHLSRALQHDDDAI